MFLPKPRQAAAIASLLIFIPAGLFVWLFLSYRLPINFSESQLWIDGHNIHVELAETYLQRRRGLMFRDSLVSDSGMLFIYPSEQYRRFWMRNTSLPLDVAFIGNDCRIQQITQLNPNSTDNVHSISPAIMALEMNQGWFAKHRIQTGDLIVQAGPFEQNPDQPQSVNPSTCFPYSLK